MVWCFRWVYIASTRVKRERAGLGYDKVTRVRTKGGRLGHVADSLTALGFAASKESACGVQESVGDSQFLFYFIFLFNSSVSKNKDMFLTLTLVVET